MVRNDNTGTHRDTGTQADQHVYNAARAADRGKCLFAHKPTDNNSVDSVVELLEYQTYCSRDSEIHNMAPYSAFGHIRVAITA
jgi:hypothetical protein